MLFLHKSTKHAVATRLLLLFHVFDLLLSTSTLLVWHQEWSVRYATLANFLKSSGKWPCVCAVGITKHRCITVTAVNGKPDDSEVDCWTSYNLTSEESRLRQANRPDLRTTNHSITSHICTYMHLFAQKQYNKATVDTMSSKYQQKLESK